MNPTIIPRLLRAEVEEHLRIFPAVGLLGPRQVGKTTLARALAEGEAGRRVTEPKRPVPACTWISKIPRTLPA